MKHYAIVYDNLTLYFHSHPVQFKVGLGFIGDLENGRVKGVDLNTMRNELEKINFSIRGREIKDLFKEYKGMETIALYFLDKVGHADFVKIIENDTEEVVIYRVK